MSTTEDTRQDTPQLGDVRRAAPGSGWLHERVVGFERDGTPIWRVANLWDTERLLRELVGLER